MLDLMRKHAQSWLIKVALGGIIIVFVFWYGWSSTGDKPRDYIAKINDSVITYDQFRNTYESELEQLRMRFQGRIPPELLEKLQLKKAVLRGMINRTILLQEAQRLGLTVTNEDLIQDIKNNPQFQRNGVFDEGVYRMYLNALKLNPAQYEIRRKQELLEGQVVSLITDSVKTSPEEIKRYWHFQNDKLLVSVLTVPSVGIDEQSEISQKELEAFFEANKKNYEVPPVLAVEYVSFAWTDLKNSIYIPEEDIRFYYKSHPKQFTKPEQVKISHILKKFPENADDTQKAETLKAAEDLHNRMVAGADFHELARQESDDKDTAEKGGSLGTFPKKALDAKLDVAAFKLNAGEVSKPILTPRGYELLKVEEKTPEVMQPYEEAHAGILEKLQEEAARKKVSGLADTFYEQVYRSANLADTAPKFGFVPKTASMTEAGGLPETGPDQKLTKEAFSLKPGEISRMVKVGDNYIIMKLSDRKAKRIPTLDEIRSLVEKDFRKDEAAKATKAKAQEIIDQLKAQPNKAVEIAQANVLAWTNPEPVTRVSGSIPKVGGGETAQDILTSLSSATPIYPDPVPVSEGMAVVKLTAVEPVAEDKFSKDAAIVDNWVTNFRKAEFLNGWIESWEKPLQDAGKIDINDKNI